MTNDPARPADNPIMLSDRSFRASCTGTDVEATASVKLLRTGDTLTVTSQHSATATARRMPSSAPAGSAFLSLPIETCATLMSGQTLVVSVALDGPLAVAVGGGAAQAVELITPETRRERNTFGPLPPRAEGTYSSPVGPGRQCVSFRLSSDAFATPPILISPEVMATSVVSNDGVFVLSAAIQ